MFWILDRISHRFTLKQPASTRRGNGRKQHQGCTVAWRAPVSGYLTYSGNSVTFDRQLHTTIDCYTTLYQMLKLQSLTDALETIFCRSLSLDEESCWSALVRSERRNGGTP